MAGNELLTGAETLKYIKFFIEAHEKCPQVDGAVFCFYRNPPSYKITSVEYAHYHERREMNKNPPYEMRLLTRLNKESAEILTCYFDSEDEIMFRMTEFLAYGNYRPSYVLNLVNANNEKLNVYTYLLCKLSGYTISNVLKVLYRDELIELLQDKTTREWFSNNVRTTVAEVLEATYIPWDPYYITNNRHLDNDELARNIYKKPFCIKAMQDRCTYSMSCLSIKEIGVNLSSIVFLNLPAAELKERGAKDEYICANPNVPIEEIFDVVGYDAILKNPTSVSVMAENPEVKHFFNKSFVVRGDRSVTRICVIQILMYLKKLYDEDKAEIKE